MKTTEELKKRSCTKLHGFEILSMLFIFEEGRRCLIFAR